jgi:hypothetical protein
MSSRLSYAAQVVLAIALLLIASSGAWAASQDPSGAWNNSWDFPDSSAKQYQLNEASAIYNIRNGHGLSAISNYYGYSTYNGTVNNNTSGSTNVLNANSTSVDAMNSDVTVTTDQSSGTASQNAKSNSLTPGGDITITH